MNLSIDAYSFKARILPVYIVIAPIILVISVYAPDGLKLSFGTASALIFLPISYLFSQIGADWGKQIEKLLWDSWGGPPTTRFLRHGNTEFNNITRDRVHDVLRNIGFAIPTEEEQSQDNVKADQCFESCVEELIRKSRDGSRFPLVTKGLTEYGFRRNLLGMKTVGLIISIGSSFFIGLLLFKQFSITNAIDPVTAVTWLISTGFIIIWLAWISEDSVKLTANRYARFLLESAFQKD